jgi:hypothetical protein
MLSDKQIAIRVFGFLILGIFCFFGLKYLMPPAAPRSVAVSTYRFPKRELDIHGFTYAGVRDEKTILAIFADRFSIRKKKIGPFSIGLIKEIAFENTVFKIYDYLNYLEDGMPPPGADHPFSKDLFQQFPVKGITGIHAAPLTIEFHNKGRIVTTLMANEGFFQFKNQAVVLRGNVRGKSGKRRLSAKEALFSPEKFTIAARGQDFTKNNGRKTQSKYIDYDLYLNPITQKYRLSDK